MIEKHLRTWSGLIMAAYVIPHLLNHMFGIFSLDAMDAARQVFNVPWRNPVGGVVLFGAFILHFALGLIALYRRSHLRMARWEAMQLVLGLLVWPLLMTHAIGTRGTDELLDVDPTYAFVVTSIWLDGPWIVLKQVALVLVVWGHLVVGVHFWLRLKPWYAKARPYLYPAAIVLPLLATLGFLRAGLEVLSESVEPGWTDAVFADFRAAPADLRALHGSLEPIFLGIVGALIALTLIARALRRHYRTRHGTFRVTLPENRSLRAPVGQTLLEAISGAGIPHASVCGGRGRCTTCRITVGDSLTDLPAPGKVERQALERINADPSVRLACQLKPRRDLRVTPLFPPSATAMHGLLPGGVHGREQPIIAMFIDLRGSTRLGEQRLPYDVLFILNLFFAEMTAALKETGGHYAQFNGDGLMALYGLDEDVAVGCRKAVTGAARMLERLDDLNHRLSNELPEPLRMGIGIHAGLAIVGTMGPPQSPILSAIGDTINTAARLEGQSKILGSPVVVSEDVLSLGEISVDGLERREVDIRGRNEPIPVFALSDPSALLAGASVTRLPGSEARHGPAAR